MMMNAVKAKSSAR